VLYYFATPQGLNTDADSVMILTLRIWILRSCVFTEAQIEG